MFRGWKKKTHSNRNNNGISVKVLQSSVTHICCAVRLCVWFLTFTWNHFVAVWQTRWKESPPFCHFILAFKPPQFHCPPTPTPPLCLCSIKMYQAGWRNIGRRGLFILSPPAHINDLAPVVPCQGDVHINSSHTRERRGTRVEHRWVAGREEKRRDRRMGRESATAFHPHCVIYNIADTTTPKFALGASREKTAISCSQGKNKRKKKLTTPNVFSCLSDTVPVAANQKHICQLQSRCQLLVVVWCIILLDLISAILIMRVTLTAGCKQLD